MKLKNTQQQIETIVKALGEIYVRPFTCKSSDPKYNAQRNLEGLTYYVSDNTLKFHHSRVNNSFETAGGLLLVVETSDALDMHNTKRGHRVCAFDVFGNCILRPELEAAKPTSKSARKQFEADIETVDLVSHYKSAIAEKLTESRNQSTRLESVADMIERL